MAAILERDALEEARLLEEQRLAEQEQQRLLEEAQFAAQQQAQIPMGLPVAPALMPQAVETPMASPVVPPLVPGLEERQSMGDVPMDSEQYQNELMRAQRGNGYLAANVSPTGDVITGGYDPNSDPREIVARREAENLQRNQYISGLVRGGATYAEALRAGLGRYPNTVNPRLALQAEALALRSQPFTPRVQTIDGVKMVQTGPRSFQRVPGPTATKAVMPPDAAAAQKVITGQISQTRKDLQRAKTAAEKDPEDVGAVRRARIYQDELKKLETQLQQGSTNWMGAAQAPQPAAVPFKEGATVRNKQNGKLYRVVNGVPVEVKE